MGTCHQPAHESQTLLGLLDGEQSALLNVELHVGALVAWTPYLEPAGDLSRKQEAAGVEDGIPPTFDQDLTGMGHPIAPAVLG